MELISEECISNANLIALAPEMLEMIKRFVMYYDGNETRPEAVYKIENAKQIIAKAEGINNDKA